MNRFVMGVFLGLVIGSMSGCMSLHNRSLSPDSDELPGKNRIYGGVRQNLENVADSTKIIEESLSDEPMAILYVTQAFLVGFSCLDLPLCVIADTVMLPDLIRVQRERNALLRQGNFDGIAH